MWPFKSKNKEPKEPLYSEHGGYPAPYAAPKVVKKEAANINPPPTEARPSQPPPPPPPPRERNITIIDGREVRVTGGHMGPIEGGSDTPPMGGSSVKTEINNGYRQLKAERTLGSAFMPSVMSAALGYDELGNNYDLLADADKVCLREGTYWRASPDAVCHKCGNLYGNHPPVQGALWLRRGCDRLVKL